MGGFSMVRKIVIILSVLMLCGCTFFGQSGYIKPENMEEKTSPGGYILKKGDYYYFANPEDENRLSRMDHELKNVIRLSDHANLSPYIEINEKDECLYYIQIDSIDNEQSIKRQLCSYDLLTKQERILFHGNVVSYTISDGWIYCSTVDPAQMYRINIQDLSVEQIGKEQTNNFAARSLNSYNGYLIYACDEAIIKTHLKSGESEAVPGYSSGLTVYNDTIYNVNYNRNNKIEQYNAKSITDNPVKSFVNDSVYTFSVYGENVAYSTLNQEIFLSCKNERKRFIDQGSNPYLTLDYLFYFDLDGNLRYKTW
jgi:hypothetical protein